MTELSRIETEDPDQALSACRGLLALIEHVACEQKRGQIEGNTCLSLPPADTWHGIALTTPLVRNALLHVERHREPAQWRKTKPKAQEACYGSDWNVISAERPLNGNGM